MHCGERLGKTQMLRDRGVTYFIQEIGAPVPLQSGRINWIEHALQCRMRHWTDKIERGLFESANRLKHFFRLRLRQRAAPNDSAHFLEVQIFGKRRTRRHGEKREPAIE